MSQEPERQPFANMGQILLLSLQCRASVCSRSLSCRTVCTSDDKFSHSEIAFLCVFTCQVKAVWLRVALIQSFLLRMQTFWWRGSLYVLSLSFLKYLCLPPGDKILFRWKFGLSTAIRRVRTAWSSVLGLEPWGIQLSMKKSFSNAFKEQLC